MKSPQHQRIIVIDITNACDKRCSNCTRFCGHHKKPFYMDFETFRRAVDSLDGYQGTGGIIGGEPTLHPEFERFVTYYGSKFPKHENPLIYPQKEFIKAVHRIEPEYLRAIENDGFPRISMVSPGLFSNMNATYKKYYEIISDNLPYQALDDHANVVYHQSGMVSRTDLGISDEDWPAIRDACRVQNEWSASITPKGAFFCEIAGVLDMLLDGPGGWPIEPGWWKRTPEEFGDQLHWCEICGFCLDTFTRDSAEEIDDMSPAWYERLKALDSPKLRSGRYNIVKIEDGKIAEESKKSNRFFSPAMPYLEHYEDRFSVHNSILFPHDFTYASIPDGEEFGTQLNRLLANSEEWIVLHSENVSLVEDFEEKIGKYILNPGTMHCIDLSKSDDPEYVSNAGAVWSGYAALFNKQAISLRQIGFDRIARMTSFVALLEMWQPEKVVELSSKMDGDSRPQSTGQRYAIWGAGSSGSIAIDMIGRAGDVVVQIVDTDKSRHGSDFYGMTIQPPEALLENQQAYDVLLIANYTRHLEIKAQAVAMGLPQEKFMFMDAFAKAVRKGK